jgi:uncharacterized repeat protein (TIGR01451 family)
MNLKSALHLLIFGLISTVTLTTAGPILGQAGAALVINEIDYDQPSTDAAEFIELKNIGPASANLEFYRLLMIDGASASAYRTISLPPVVIGPGDYFVICGDPAAVANCDLDISPNTNLIQNGGPDAVALLANDTIVDGLSYEGDTAAPYREGSGAGLVDSGDQERVGLSRRPDGTDTDRNNIDFSLRCITPGAANSEASTDCTLVVNEEADLALTVTDSADPVNQGEAVTYQVSLSNGGPELAQNVVLTDTLPAGVSFIAAVADRGSCSESGGVVSCGLGDLEPQALVTVQITVSALTVGLSRHDLTVGSATADPNPANNSASEATTVNHPPQNINNLLTLGQVVTAYDPTDGRAAAGVFTLSATFSNDGPSAVEGLYFQVVTLSPEANRLLNADAGPGGVGAVISVPGSALGQDGRLDSGEAFSLDFEIGLAERRAFALEVDAYGQPLAGNGGLVAQAAAAFALKGQPDPLPGNPAYTLFLPVVMGGPSAP